MTEASSPTHDQIAEIVHELRAPLSVASGYLVMLRDGTLGEPPARWAQPLDVLTVKLEEARLLVDDILALSRIDHGVDATIEEVVDLVAVAHTAVRRADPRARLLGGTVELQPAGAAVVFAIGDQRCTLRILDNLINNALLYSGKVRRVVVSVELGDGPQVTVEDWGPGVPDHLRDRIFEPFFRDETSQQLGSGLGLFVSRRLAQQMHGNLALDERAGPGSRFVLRLRTLDSSHDTRREAREPTSL